MRYQTGHKQETRAKIIAASGRAFRQHGYAGIGVDGLAKQAELTSGAFYGHFKGKALAFRAAAVAGLVELQDTIADLQTTHGDIWFEKFVDLYLGEKRLATLEHSCGLQSLTAEVMRADDETKTAYEEQLLIVIDLVAQNLPAQHKASHEIAWSVLALLSGAVTLSRSVQSASTAEAIAMGAKHAVMTLVTT